MKTFLALAALLAAASCGVDGAPRRPAPETAAPASGITVSGDARIGIATD